MALLNYGKRIVGFSRYQQQLGFGGYLASKTTHGHHHHRCLLTGVNRHNNNNNNKKSESELPPKPPLSSKGFSVFTNLFRKFFVKAVPPKPTPAQVILGKILEAVQNMNRNQEENPSVEEMKLLFHELVNNLTDEGLVKVLVELTKVGVPPPSYLVPSIHSGRLIKDLVYNLSIDMMPLFQQVMVDVVKHTYKSLINRNDRVLHTPHKMCIAIDVSHISKEHIRVLVIADLIVVCGIDMKHADSPYGYEPTIQKVTRIPPFSNYLHQEVTASVIQDHLYVVFRESVVVGKQVPVVFQIKLLRTNPILYSSPVDHFTSLFGYDEEELDDGQSGDDGNGPSSTDSSGMTAGNKGTTDI